ncbi:MAG: hypothetical protein ISS35_10525 [Kiritimatiellae bacterium]|nr:hypothetical protein [Kiritimatiellia bacterium]
MKSRLNIIVLIFVVILAGLMAVSGFMLFQGIRKYNTAEKQASRLFETLSSYYKANPFPSSANVAVREGNAENMDAWATRIVEEMKKGESKVVEKSPSLFMRRLGDSRKSLLEAAESNNVKVRDLFAFGFEQYLGDDGHRPPPSLVPQLTHQLVAIESVTRLLIENNVTSIDTIVRRDVEGTAGSVQSDRPTRADRGTRLTRKRQDRLPKDEEEHSDDKAKEEALFTTEKLVLEFRARENNAVGLINALSAMPLPVAVSRIEFRRDEAEVVIPPLPVPAEGESAATMIIPKSEQVHDRRIVSGLTEAPLWIRLELTIFRFSREESGEST